MSSINTDLLIIGSCALKHYFPDYSKEPNDIDYAVSELGLFPKHKGIEYLVNPIILKYQTNGYLKPELLLSLKISHLFYDINWNKHLFHVQFLLNKGVKYNIDLINELREYWEQNKPKIRRSNLVNTKEEFFTNGINQTIDQHDYLHTLLNPIPSYTKLLKDGFDVELDVDKWDYMLYDEKCDVVYEETAVMAFERYKTTHFREAFKLQLKDNIIKHFPQYIALFAIENYPKLESPREDYRTKINKQLCN